MPWSCLSSRSTLNSANRLRNPVQQLGQQPATTATHFGVFALQPLAQPLLRLQTQRDQLAGRVEAGLIVLGPKLADQLAGLTHNSCFARGNHLGRFGRRFRGLGASTAVCGFASSGLFCSSLAGFCDSAAGASTFGCCCGCGSVTVLAGASDLAAGWSALAAVQSQKIAESNDPQREKVRMLPCSWRSYGDSVFPEQHPRREGDSAGKTQTAQLSFIGRGK